MRRSGDGASLPNEGDHMLARFRRAFRRDDGASAVEFALVLPILLLLVFGIISFGLYFAGALGMSNASREAARYGVVQNRTCSDIVTTVKNGVAGTIGINYPVTVTISRPTSTAPTTCTASIAANGTVSFPNGNQTKIMCQGSKTNQDELTVSTAATANMLIPAFFVSSDFPLNGKGAYRCEFS
jgi:Flp pilus assembly protein TadG